MKNDDDDCEDFTEEEKKKENFKGNRTKRKKNCKLFSNL
jgi:hypothetical protein